MNIATAFYKFKDTLFDKTVEAQNEKTSKQKS